MAELSGRGRFSTVMGLIGSGHAVSHFYLLALPPLFSLLQAEFDIGHPEAVFYAIGGFLLLCVTTVGMAPCRPALGPTAAE